MKFDKAKIIDSGKRLNINTAPEELKSLFSRMNALVIDGAAENIYLEYRDGDYVVKVEVPYKDITKELNTELKGTGYYIAGVDEDPVYEYYYLSKRVNDSIKKGSKIANVVSKIRRVKDDAKSEAAKKLLKMILQPDQITDSENDQQFDYMMLGRLQSDCDYYLGNGGRDADHCLWAHDETKQIQKMLDIYKGLKVKPEWLTLEQIKQYAKDMGADMKKLNFNI